ncbi:MAG: DEAD/DEAH box helicase [Gammaproteobacteria bacterium]|nr:DEAD/DEAH box helicase [Gammaproteobacteria bacterium]
MPVTKRRKAAAKPRRLSRTQAPEDLSTHEWQVGLRRQYGRDQSFTLENLGDELIFSEFAVHNPASGRTYRVAIRGAGLGDNYCACPDFATNLLGTCKHVEFVLGRLERRRGGKAALRRGFEADYSELFLRYGAERHICFRAGRRCTPALLKRARDLFDSEHGWCLPSARFDRLEEFLAAARRSRHEVRCYDDALAFVAERRADDARRRRLIDLFPQGSDTPALRELLNLPLYPYQCEGALFAVRAGRATIADDMGLGKTVQAIAAGEILLRHFAIERVLVVCPTSLKHQWCEEIARLTGRDALLVGGLRRERGRQFAQPATFKITNYDTVRRDLDLINAWAPDLVIADEAQRIKNWDTKAARAMKQIRSRYALVLTGTPLENRLRELVSIVQFVDQHRLGPTWRFLERHQITADTGQVVGYRHLDEVAATLAPILIRRRKAEVLDQLPPRREKVYLLPLTTPQRTVHEEHAETVARIVARWKKQHFLSDRDQKILMAALQSMRMVCDSTYLLNPKQDHGQKIPELLRVLGDLLADPDLKVVIFSQWLRSHELLSSALDHAGHGYVLFHGGVPGRKRGALVKQFQTEPACRVFLSTDAGGVGLNLQCASVVMNLDLPWNPAVLEQRIGRAHRLGQHRSVQVLNFVAEACIEHNLMGLLEFKQSLAAGVLDGGENQVHLGGSRLARFMESVERATGQPVADPPPLVPVDSRAVGAADGESAGEITDGTADRPLEGDADHNRDPWQPLLAFAQTLLTEMAEPSRRQQRQSSSGMVRRDPQTGERYLRLPVPDQDKITRLLDALRDVLAG